MIDPQLLRFLIPSVSAAWALGCGVVAMLVGSGALDLAVAEAMKVSAASGLIAVFAIGLFSARFARAVGGRPLQAVIESDMGLFVAFSAGMAIRILGTVALFLACRYQMGASPETLATLVLGWYLYLTLIEISVVVARSSKFFESVADANSSVRGSSDYLS